jgi:hypothetical protein
VRRGGRRSSVRRVLRSCSAGGTEAGRSGYTASHPSAIGLVSCGVALSRDGRGAGARRVQRLALGQAGACSIAPGRGMQGQAACRGAAALDRTRAGEGAPGSGRLLACSASWR